MKRTRVVFVHGWAGSADSWKPVLDLLDPRKWDATAVRLPGSPGGTGAPMTVRAGAAMLVDMLRADAEPALIVGHSMGAQITMLAHGDAPTCVLAELVVDPAYGADSSERDHMEEWAARIETDGHAAVAAFFESALDGLPAVSAQRLIDDLHRTSAATIASYLRSEYVDADAIGLLPATADAAARRTRPVFSLHSTPASAAREGFIPSPEGSSSRTWIGYGHFLHLQDPQRFVTDLDGWRNETMIAVRPTDALASAPSV